MTTITGLARLWLGLAAALLAVSCSPPQGEPARDASDLATVPSAEVAAMLGLLPPQENAELAATRYRSRQERLADCLGSRGYSYEPSDGSDLPAFVDGMLAGSDEWFAYYGFGISTLALPQRELEDGLIGYLDTQPELTLAHVPSEEVLGMEEVLYGNDRDVGCVDDAFVAFPRWQEIPADLNGAVTDLRDQIEADARVSAHMDEVRRCMHERDMVFTSLNEVHEQFFSSTSALADEYLHDPDRSVSDLEWGRRLGDLQREELGYASALADCGAGSEALAAVRLEVLRTYQSGDILGVDATAAGPGTAAWPSAAPILDWGSR